MLFSDILGYIFLVFFLLPLLMFAVVAVKRKVKKRNEEIHRNHILHIAFGRVLGQPQFRRLEPRYRSRAR